MDIQAEHGSLDREDVADAVDPHFTRLSRCYEDAQPATDFASGQVTLRFVVGLDGSTSSVHVRSSDLGSYEVERCLVAVASRIRFARPQGYGVASFEYSLEFRSTGAIPVVQLAADALAGELPAIGNRLLEDCGGPGHQRAAGHALRRPPRPGPLGRLRLARPAQRRARGLPGPLAPPRGAHGRPAGRRDGPGRHLPAPRRRRRRPPALSTTPRQEPSRSVYGRRRPRTR